MASIAKVKPRESGDSKDFYEKLYTFMKRFFPEAYQLYIGLKGMRTNESVFGAIICAWQQAEMHKGFAYSWQRQHLSPRG